MNENVGKRIKEIVDNFYKTPIGELPETHFWIDRENHLCCGQIRSKIIVDTNEVKQKVFDDIGDVLDENKGYMSGENWEKLGQRHLSTLKTKQHN